MIQSRGMKGISDKIDQDPTVNFGQQKTRRKFKTAPVGLDNVEPVADGIRAEFHICPVHGHLT